MAESDFPGREGIADPGSPGTPETVWIHRRAVARPPPAPPSDLGGQPGDGASGSVLEGIAGRDDRPARHRLYCRIEDLEVSPLDDPVSTGAPYVLGSSGSGLVLELTQRAADGKLLGAFRLTGRTALKLAACCIALSATHSDPSKVLQELGHDLARLGLKVGELRCVS